MLRRTLDYDFPNQKAAVLVADADASPLKWEPAGTWYLAGSTTYYHSFPAKETDPPAPVVYKTNIRLKDDEFLLPLRLTRGRKAIRVRVTYRAGGPSAAAGDASPGIRVVGNRLHRP